MKARRLLYIGGLLGVGLLGYHLAAHRDRRGGQRRR